jgi:hypothetical protein
LKQNKITPYALTYAPLYKWASLAIEGSQGKAWIKILGKDQESGATAALVKYNAGFSQPGGVSAVFSDSIVIEGRLERGGAACNRLAYWYQPAGAEYAPIQTDTDVTRFVITGGFGEEGSSDPVFLPNIELDDPPWEVSERGNVWSEKTLRIDPVANCLITYQFATGFTQFLGGKKWAHPDLEEAYCIEGAGWDYVGEVETFVNLLPGTYIYHRPNATFHGTATTYEVPRRLFVKYYNADINMKFKRSIVEDITPATTPEFTPLQTPTVS